MSFSFSIRSQPDSNFNPSATESPAIFSDDDQPQTTTANTYITEFSQSDAPQSPNSKPIAPLPDTWAPRMKLKSFAGLPLQSNPLDSSLKFESLDLNTDDSMGHGLNLRVRGEKEEFADFEQRILKEDIDRLPDAPGLDDYEKVPVEGFGLAYLAGYGWKEGLGIGRNAKEDVKIHEIKGKFGRGGLGFSGEAVKMENNGVDN